MVERNEVRQHRPDMERVTEGLEKSLADAQRLIDAFLRQDPRAIIVQETGNEIFSTREVLGLRPRVKPNPNLETS